MTGNFDLLGDPIPEGFGKRGRPPHQVDDKKRSKVILLTAIGRTIAEIAMALGISEPTLKRYYFRELKSREEAKFRVEGTRLLKLYEGVEEGNVAANKELGKVLDKADRDEGPYGLRALATPQPRKSKLGKKEEAANAAQSAGQDSDWGDDLRLPETMN